MLHSRKLHPNLSCDCCWVRLACVSRGLRPWRYESSLLWTHSTSGVALDWGGVALYECELVASRRVIWLDWTEVLVGKVSDFHLRRKRRLVKNIYQEKTTIASDLKIGSWKSIPYITHNFVLFVRYFDCIKTIIMLTYWKNSQLIFRYAIFR